MDPNAVALFTLEDRPSTLAILIVAPRGRTPLSCVRKHRLSRSVPLRDPMLTQSGYVPIRFAPRLSLNGSSRSIIGYVRWKMCWHSTRSPTSPGNRCSAWMKNPCPARRCPPRPASQARAPRPFPVAPPYGAPYAQARQLAQSGRDRVQLGRAPVPGKPSDRPPGSAEVRNPDLELPRQPAKTCIRWNFTREAARTKFGYNQNEVWPQKESFYAVADLVPGRRPLRHVSFPTQRICQITD